MLLLDEPTNHLDLEGVLWLERFVQQSSIAMLFVTHDRMFLEHTASRIIELSPAYPGGTFKTEGDYSEFLRRKEAFLEAQVAAQSALANKVRRDTAWLRQGIEGRQTRNKTQVAAAAERRAELKQTRGRNEAPTKTTAIDFQATERKTKKLLALHSVGKTMGDKPLFESLELTLTPGQRIGLVGINGSGKTTLLRLANGELEPDTGTIKKGTGTPHRHLQPASRHPRPDADAAGSVVPRWRHGRLPGQAGARDRVGEAVPLRAGSTGHHGLQSVRRRTGPRVDREPDARTGGRAPAGRTDERPGHPVTGGSGAGCWSSPALVLVTHDRFMLERIATEYLGLDGSGNAKSFQTHEEWPAAAAAAQREANAAKPKAAAAGKAEPASSRTRNDASTNRWKT